LLERGEHVTGSDREDSPQAEALRAAGVQVRIGHATGNVNGATRVVRSSAVGEDNEEVRAARAKGIPVYKRAEFLDQLLANQQVIAVAGSHGKTTTTAMLAWMLTALNQRPGFTIGSQAANLGTNAAAGGGRLFVIEADEYDHMFLGLQPEFALVTNVEHDHPDMFPTPAAFRAAFEQFVERIKAGGVLLACIEDAGAAELLQYAAAKSIKTYAYAHSHSGAQYTMGEVSQNDAGYSFEAMRAGDPLARLQLQVPGMHNALNALGALAIADLLGLNLNEAAMALSDFRGTSRRFEVRGEAQGIIVVDDYAHHPTEIRSTLAAAKARYAGRRVLAVWQPHTYSRTQTLAADYAAAFGDADRVLVTQVYAAREEQPTGFDINAIVSTIPGAMLARDFGDAKQILHNETRPGDVLVVMSAGDAIHLSEEFFAELSSEEEDHA
jgi:UDP-N-acetylmuramate--alanine ligase